jgi:hypothetical protein
LVRKFQENSDWLKGNSQKAFSLVESVIPRVLNHCSLESQSNMHFTLAKCKLACLSEGFLVFFSKINLQVSENAISALESMEKAKEGFKKLQMVQKIADVCYLEARTCNAIKDIKKRDEVSKEFRENCQLYEKRKNQIGFAVNFVVDVNTLLKELHNLVK